MSESSYEFRKRLNVVHKPGRRDLSLEAKSGEVAIRDGWKIEVGPEASEYVVNVAKDLQDYLFTSMNVSTLLVRESPSGGKAIRLTSAARSPELGKNLTVARSYRIVVEQDAISICGFDERGVGQGCYYLEDLMNLREGPFVPVMDEVRAPVFSPRMVHSGWGIDRYPDQHLNAMAHAGMDSILIFVKAPNMTPTGHVDINDLIDRAAHYGLDVYLYSYLIGRYHPDDPKAEEFYESTYGELIKAHPKAKGLIFVGESCEFPSKDTRTTGRLRLDPDTGAGMNSEGCYDPKADSRPSPGWWPCTDYPQWLNLLKGIMRKYNPELDIVFWTYNWGWTPEEDRLALIRSLPTDLTMQATFEMFEKIEKEGIVTTCVDYTASFEGPGKYFSSEAVVAHERGLRLYSMVNTGGMTWDFGVIPYQPIPFQWEKRYKAILDAHEKWGLTGLMEGHHYGWWPSFVSELAKWAYWSPAVSREEMADKIAVRDFGAEAGPLAVRAWKAWSKAERDYVPTNEDQYGPFRIGPSYPLFLNQKPVPVPASPYSHFGSEIVITDYQPHEPKDVETEIHILQRMAAKWEEGNELMTEAKELTPETKRADAKRMLAMGKFILNSIYTTIHTKRWWLLKKKLQNETDPDKVNAILDDLTLLAEDEIANAQVTIPLVEFDSRLGWEPSMEYLGDREHLEWKIGILRKIVDEEIPALRE